MSSSFARALAAVLALSAGPALAGGLGQSVVVPPIAPPAPIAVAPSSDWTGGFAGVQAEAGTLSFESDDGGVDIDGEGTLFGVNAGYDRDLGRFVLGGEVQYERSDVELGFDVSDELAFDLELSSVFRTGVRAGYDGGRFMPYLTGGYVRAEVEASIGAASDEATYSGGYFGVGVDYRLRDSVTLGAQVLRSDFDQVDGDDIEGGDVGLNTVGLRATYNF